MMKKEAANCETIVLIGSVTGTVTGGGGPKMWKNFVTSITDGTL